MAHRGFKPKRILDLAGLSQGRLRLRDTADLDIAGRYATVAHCWGNAKTLKLLSGNIAALQDQILAGDLPTSYKEALLVARKFDIQYLWIDSLCIIQDSPEDWLREASMMGQVYRHSLLNIALAGAADSSEPSFGARNPDTIRPAYVEAEWDGQPKQGSYIVDEDIQADMSSSKLRSRGWVLQEVYLAPRVLTLGKEQMWYECVEGLACETYPGWVPSARFNQTQAYRQRAARDEPANHLLWEGTVEAYTECDLTILTDRMIAISGVADYFRRDLGDEYVAGL